MLWYLSQTNSHVIGECKHRSLCFVKSIVNLTEENQSYLNITSGCICPGHTLTLECAVALTRSGQGGKTVWKGTAFKCPNANNEITLVHNQFPTDDGVYGACNNNSIMGRSLQVVVDSHTYTSQLNVKINSDIRNQNIICQYDEDTRVISTVGSIKLIKRGMLATIIIMLSLTL